MSISGSNESNMITISYSPTKREVARRPVNPLDTIVDHMYSQFNALRIIDCTGAEPEQLFYVPLPDRITRDYPDGPSDSMHDIGHGILTAEFNTEENPDAVGICLSTITNQCQQRFGLPAPITISGDGLAVFTVEGDQNKLEGLGEFIAVMKSPDLCYSIHIDYVGS